MKRHAMLIAPLLVLVAVAVAVGCASKEQPKGTVRLDEKAPWRVQLPDSRWKDLTSKDGWLDVTAKLKNEQKVLFELELGRVPGLGDRPPVCVDGEFRMTVDVPDGLVGGGGRLFWKNSYWKWQEARWRNFVRAGKTTWSTTIAEKDLAAVGIYVYVKPWMDYSGPVRVRVDQLFVRAGPIAKPRLPVKGEVEKSLIKAKWQADPAYRGGKAEIRNGHPALLCQLNTADPKRLSAAAFVPIDPPLNMTERGWFVTVKVCPSLVTTAKFKCGLHASAVSEDGGVVWGPWRPLTRAGEATVAVYPTAKWPLPMAYRSEAFDPARVTGLGIRYTADQAEPRNYEGVLEIVRAEVARAPRELIAERRLTAKALNDILSPPKPTAVAAPPKPTPIKTFVENSGVDWPWPTDERGEPVYPVLGAKVYMNDGTKGGLRLLQKKIAGDFARYKAHRVKLVRCWTLGDLRGFPRDQNGRFVLTKNYLDDLDVLLNAARERVKLIPVLLDFLVCDGGERENLGFVGEEEAIFKDPKVRKQFIDAIQPILKRLCGSPDVVAAIDAFNEPSHVRARPEQVAQTVRDIVQRIREISKTMPVTVGARNSVDLASHWQRIPGAELSSFHWFQKIAAGNRQAWAPATVDRSKTIISECEASPSVADTLDTVHQAGFRGVLFWSCHGNDGISPIGLEQLKAYAAWVRKHRGN